MKEVTLQALLKALAERGSVTARELAESIGVKSKSVLIRAYEVRKYGCVEVDGSEVRPGPRFRECFEFFVESLRPPVRVAYVMLGDVHLGRRTPKFSVAVVERMAAVYAGRLRELRESGYRVVGLGLGDYVDGAGIYGRQAYEQELDPNAQVAEFARIFHPWFSEVDEFYGVVGNHGRTSEDEQGNYDYFAMFAAASPVLGRRARLSARYADVFADGVGRVMLLAHQRFRTYYGVPDYSVRRFVAQHVLRDRRIEMVCLGHLHVLKFSEELGLPVVMNGTFLLDDELSRQMGLVGFPGQAVLIFEDGKYRYEAVRLA